MAPSGKGGQRSDRREKGTSVDAHHLYEFKSMAVQKALRFYKIARKQMLVIVNDVYVKFGRCPSAMKEAQVAIMA